MEKGFYEYKSHTCKNSHQAVTNQLSMGVWPECCLLLLSLKHLHYIYRTNYVTHMCCLFKIMTVMHIHYLSLCVGLSIWSDADRRKLRGR